jgi:hypothetical protein
VRRSGLILILLVGGTLAFSFGRRDPIDAFWRWFRDHETELLRVRTGHEAIAGDLDRALSRVDTNLTWEFGPADAAPREFVISAGGVKAAFPVVQRLASGAPVLPRWKVTPFRQRSPDVTEVHIDGIALDARHVEFLMEPEGTLLALVISVPNFRPTPTKAYEQAVYLLLDAMLGEYTVETKIGAIDIGGVENRKPGQWQPLTSVARAVDAVAVR